MLDTQHKKTRPAPRLSGERTDRCWTLAQLKEEPMKNSLRVLRAERDLSQQELGRRLGVSRQTINAIEAGRHDPSLSLAFAIAKLFGKLIEDIFDSRH
jgi:putative transcriptional regulator